METRWCIVGFMTTTQKYTILVHRSPISGEVSIWHANDDDALNEATTELLKKMWADGEIATVHPKPGESRADFGRRINDFENVRRVVEGKTPFTVLVSRGIDETDEGWKVRAHTRPGRHFIVRENDVILEILPLIVLPTLPQWEGAVTMQEIDIPA